MKNENQDPGLPHPSEEAGQLAFFLVSMLSLGRYDSVDGLLALGVEQFDDPSAMLVMMATSGVEAKHLPSREAFEQNLRARMMDTLVSDGVQNPEEEVDALLKLLNEAYMFV